MIIKKLIPLKLSEQLLIFKRPLILCAVLCFVNVFHRVNAPDLVRRKVTAMGLYLGKLGPNWGPVERIKSSAGYGAYHLKMMDGTPIPRAWSIDNLLFVPHDPNTD